VKETAEMKGHARGLEEGLAKGKAEGLEEGMARGMAEGKAEGEKSKARQIAHNLKSIGVSPDTIAMSTGLSLEEIDRL
jgi:flagellar biosynthesis/type III secretory pathway protein FliH